MEELAYFCKVTCFLFCFISNCIEGYFITDYNVNAGDEETHDDWADRIRQEYRAKKMAQERAFNRGSSKQSSHNGSSKKSSKPDSDQSGKKYSKEHLDGARERMREKFDVRTARDTTMEVLKMRMKYEERYKTVLESVSGSRVSSDRDCDKQRLIYDEIPWPSLKGDNSDLDVLFSQMDKGSAEYKKYLRDQQIRWHPDKFLQRFGENLSETDKRRIMDRVTRLSQSLNKLKT